MITCPPKKTMRVSFEVNTYQKVLEIWQKFKRGQMPPSISLDDHLLHAVFKFHQSQINHVILYYSKEKNDCLLMCKVDNEYRNISASIEPLEKLEYSIIATYC